MLRFGFQVLGVTKDASAGEIRKRYRELALQLHPDKNLHSTEDASAKFQALQKVWSVLGDAAKRQVYDDTGLADDDGLQGTDFNNLRDYFATIFAPVTPDAIDNFALEYRGSAEETQDLVACYREASGDMQTVFTQMMCSEPDTDSHRFMDTIRQAQEQVKVEPLPPDGFGLEVCGGCQVLLLEVRSRATKRFAAWATQTQGRPHVKDPLRPRKSKSASSSALVAAIQSRAGRADAALDALALKYAAPEKAKRGAGKSKPATKQRKPDHPGREAPTAGERTEDTHMAQEEEGAAGRTQVQDKAERGEGEGVRKGERAGKQATQDSVPVEKADSTRATHQPASKRSRTSK
ncbi:MAG: hypothetical protein WDW38_000935 [Sanguina aurantia]